MEKSKESKRRKDKNSDDEEKRREKKSKRARTRSRSPAEHRERDSRRKRRRSKSKSPDVPVKQEKLGNTEKVQEVKKEVPARRAKETDMLNTRTGGAYIPPARLRMMQAQITDKSSVAYQRLAWEALKKSIHGHINKINVGNIGIIIKELLKENIVRGRGLLCRSVIQAQAASPTFTNVYAALVAAVNSRFPNIGELLLKRLVIQFKRGFKRNDKPTCISSASFIAHLVNQRVAHEILALELLTLLVETPTDDSVEVAIAFLKECGQKLTEVSSKGVNAIFEMLRNILHEGQLDKRVQYMIEVMFQVWKDGFKDHPALIEELELVPEEEQFTHLLMLDEATDPQDILNVFKFDDKYEENEQKYKTLSKEILGSDAESDEEGGSGESGSEEEDDDEEEEQKEVTIIDNTETNLVALRRTIYLTINSSLDFEECAHKLMKMQLKPGQEVELCHMFLDCCAEQRTYEKFYGLLAQRFCNINRIYIGPFEEIFKDSYATAHRLDTNRLRNVSKFFAHLLFTDSISWEVLDCVKLNEEDTTSSSRIYIKILFQELAEYMGLKKLNDRLKDPTLQDAFSGIFPRDNPKNTRFSINFFTSIGLGGLTDELREHLKQMPKVAPQTVREIKVDSESSSDSSSDSDSSTDPSSTSSPSSTDDDEEEDDDDDAAKKSKKKKTKKDKNKQKEAPTLAEEVANEKNERWGHDGFYDTYGKGARRMDSIPDKQDREEFARPRDRRNDRGDDDRRGGRYEDANQNTDFRRNKDEFRDRRNENRSQGNDDRSQKNEDRSQRNENRSQRNENRSQRNEDRSQRNEERGRNDNRDVRGRQDEDRSRRNEEYNDRSSDRPRRDDDRYRRDDNRNQNNDRGRKDLREDEKTNRYDDRSRKINDRAIRDDDKPSRDDDRRRNDEDRLRKDDDRSNRGNERIRKGEDRANRDVDSDEDDRPRRFNDKSRKGDDRSRRTDERIPKDNNKSHVDEDRVLRNEEKGRRDNERTRDDRSDDKAYREDRGRKDEEKSRKIDSRAREFKDDKRQKGNERDRKGDDRIRREEVEDSRSKKKFTEDTTERDSNRKKGKERRDDNESICRRKDYDEQGERHQRPKGDERDRKGDDRIRREEVEDSRSKKKYTEDKNERDNNRKKGKDSREDNESTSRRKDYDEQSERHQNGDSRKLEDGKDLEASNKTNKEHKKKSKKEKKSKKDKKKIVNNSDDDDDDYFQRKNKAKNSDDDDYFKRKEKRRKDSTETDSDSSSSSSSEEETTAPGRYWDNFDIKGRKETVLEPKEIRS